MIPASETPTQIPATLAPSATSTMQQPSFEGVGVAIDPLSIVLSPGLASGSRGLQFPCNDDESVSPPWGMTPSHVQLKLEGYLLQGKFHEPQIYVYPAQAYAEIVPLAFESVQRLNNILGNTGAPINEEQLPAIPLFNAQQVFASNIQVISFQNGQGVRFLTEYAQYAASANNQDLFYHFQGLTNDGAYYIIAILPINNPFLAETSDGGAALPPQSVPYPYFADPNADMQLYYKSVTDVLNVTPSQEFTPTISQLDLLIQSIKITPNPTFLGRRYCEPVRLSKTPLQRGVFV
jgi:hypothetical protein